MKQKLRLAVITQYFFPVAAGIEVNILETYSELAKQGWSVTLHTSQNTLTEQNVLPAAENVRGIQVIRYRSGPLGFSPRLAYAQTDLICLHNFNVLPHLFIYLKSLWHRLIGKKSYGLFITPHGGYTPQWLAFPPLTRIFKRLYHQTLGKLFLNYLSDGIRAISRWEQTELIRQGINPPKITLIQNGLDKQALFNNLKLASPQIKRQVKAWGKYFLSMGRISPIKNYETTIAALQKITPSVKLVIVGPVESPTYLATLRKLATDLKVSDRVIFAGVVRGADKYYLMGKTLAFIHMAHWESFCNVVYEAMSQHTLCLVADNTALTSLIESGLTGLVVSTESSSELAKTINHLLSPRSADLVKAIKANLSQKDFPTWERTAALMANTYQVIIRKYV